MMRLEKQNKGHARRKLVGIVMGAVASVVPMTGCETTPMNEYDAAALGMAMGAEASARDGNYDAARAFAYGSAFAGEAGRRQHELNVAREGRSQINIYNNPEEQSGVQEQIPIAPDWPDWQKRYDLNGDGIFETVGVDLNKDGFFDIGKEHFYVGPLKRNAVIAWKKYKLMIDNDGDGEFERHVFISGEYKGKILHVDGDYVLVDDDGDNIIDRKVTIDDWIREWRLHYL